MRLGDCSHGGMSNKHAQLQAVSEWLMEFSVLWAVFPVLDQLISNAPLRIGIITSSVGISLISGIGGILLRKGEHK
jgi:hypothetical protein